MSAPAVAQLVDGLDDGPTIPEVLVRREPRPGDVLGGLGPRWTCIARVPFGSTVDIDHVLLSTAGVFVVTVVDEFGPQLQHAITEARWRARKIGFLVDRAGRPFVTPVLVVPGRGAHEMVDGVLVCGAADAACWNADLDQLPPTLDVRSVSEMVDILIDHTLRTDEVNAVAAGRHVTPRY